MHLFIHTLFLMLLTVKAFSDEISDLPYSAPDQIVALTQESGKIGNTISPLSGQPCLRQTDLIAKGAQEVILKRMFISQHRDWHANQNLLLSKSLTKHEPIIESGWVIFPHTRLDHLTVTKRKHHVTKSIKNDVRIINPNGVALTFNLGLDGFVQLVDKPYGICNSTSYDDTPSAQYDLRNTKIIKTNASIDVYSPEGSIYQYKQKSLNTFSNRDDHTETTKSHYLLSKETLPNGKVLRYHYNRNGELVRVDSLDPKEQHIYASLDIDSSPNQLTSKFSTNSGMAATYLQTPNKSQFVSPKDTGTVNLLSINSANTPSYSKETLSFDKALLGSYSGKRGQFLCQYSESGENYSKNKRVSKLLLPSDGVQFHAVHEFNYDPPLVGKKPGSTCVKNIDGSYVIYEYSPQLLLAAVKHFDATSVLKKSKEFNWTDNHWLSSLTVQDGNGYLLYKRTYQYDDFGNPTLEVFCGDITGDGAYENITTTRVYSNDTRHLLLEEKNDDGKILTFQYLPNTHLITAKFIKESTHILLREFYEYDDCNNLIKKIEDNGITNDPINLFGVTERKITNYILRNQQPFLHLPEWIEEKYLENGAEKTLKRTHLSYDVYGNVCEESIYGADGVLGYTLLKSYDESGNLISQTNALGQEAIYRYDDKGRRISSTNFSKNLQTKMGYDQRDRLTKLEEKGIDNLVHSTTFAYDLNDHLIRKIDPFQNITEYTYDPLCHKVTRTSTAPIQGLDDRVVPVTTLSTYDSFGRELSKTDANGNTKTFRYAGHTSPIEIIYDDGSKESFSYTRTGLLKDHIDQEGLKTSYDYDIFGKMISKSLSTSNNEIAKENFVYNNLRLTEKTDREGNKTFYTYDGAGRLVAEESCGKIINYSYDALGYLSTTINQNGKNTLYTHYKKDVLDRTLEEYRTDAQGELLSKTAYSYDSDGNISAITKNINGNEATETFSYDSFQRLIESCDALGNKTKTIYNEHAINALGQRVLQVTTVDPKNKSVVKTEDPYDRVVQEEGIDYDNKLVSSEKMVYDPNGNLLQKKNLIFQNGNYQRTLETLYSYTPYNKVSHLTRAANSIDSRTIAYTYSPNGKLATKTKPDGTTISYTYHPLGFLKTLTSGNKLKLSYAYTLEGKLIEAKDEVKNISLKRNIDPHGNILSEELSTGLAIQKTYDAFDRPISIGLPDQGQVLYTYDPLFLRTVSRTSSSGDVLYTHQYTNYDSSSYLVHSEKSIKLLYI